MCSAVWLNKGVPSCYGRLRLRDLYLRRLRPTDLKIDKQAVCGTVLPFGSGPDGCFAVFVSEETALLYRADAMHRRSEVDSPDAEEFVEHFEWKEG